MAYDPVSQKIVMFGGMAVEYTANLEFDGLTGRTNGDGCAVACAAGRHGVRCNAQKLCCRWLEWSKLSLETPGVGRRDIDWTQMKLPKPETDDRTDAFYDPRNGQRRYLRRI